MTTFASFTTADAKSVARQFLDNVWNLGNLDEVGENDAYRQLVSDFRLGFPDLHLGAERVGDCIVVERVLESDRAGSSRWTAMVRSTIRGTHGGEFLGVAATNNPVEWSRVDVLEVASPPMSGNDRNARVLKVIDGANWDVLGVLSQIGASAFTAVAS